MNNLRKEFIKFAISVNILRFGKFITKAGRISPYFFNAGLFNEGASLYKVAQFYTKTLQVSCIKYNMLFGAAYKGITLASATAIVLANQGHNIPFAYNRKEIKNHGEGGITIGAKLQGRVVIIDDVISTGKSIHESISIIRAAGAIPCAVLIALDRMEKSDEKNTLLQYSAVQKISMTYNIPVLSISNLDDLLEYSKFTNIDIKLAQYRNAIQKYRSRYGILNNF